MEELGREVARLKEDGKLKDEVIALLKSDIKGVRSESNFEVVEARRELGEAREGERRAKLEVEELSRMASKAAAWVTELERQAEALGRAQIGLGERAGVDARMRRRHLEEMRALEKDCSDLASERDALSQKVKSEMVFFCVVDVVIEAEIAPRLPARGTPYPKRWMGAQTLCSFSFSCSRGPELCRTRAPGPKDPRL